MNIETMVHVEIQRNLELMRKLDQHTDEYKEVAEETMKLMDRAAKMEELNILHEEQKLKLKQIDEDRKDHAWEHFLKGLGIVLPVTVACVGAFGLSVLERTEIVTSTPAREWFKRTLRLS